MSQKQILFQGFQYIDKQQEKQNLTLKVSLEKKTKTFVKNNKQLKTLLYVPNNHLFFKKLVRIDDLSNRINVKARQNSVGSLRFVSDYKINFQDENAHNRNSINGEADSRCSIDTSTISSFHQQNQLTAAASGLLSLSSSFVHLKTIYLINNLHFFFSIDSLLINNEDNPHECHLNSTTIDETTLTSNGNMPLLCGVCQDRASGKHYGVLSCEVITN